MFCAVGFNGDANGLGYRLPPRYPGVPPGRTPDLGQVDLGSLVGFSALRAMEEFQLIRNPTLGRIRFESTFANFNRGWIAGESIFQCHIPGNFCTWEEFFSEFYY